MTVTNDLSSQNHFLIKNQTDLGIRYKKINKVIPFFIVLALTLLSFGLAWIAAYTKKTWQEFRSGKKLIFIKGNPQQALPTPIPAAPAIPKLPATPKSISISKEIPPPALPLEKPKTPLPLQLPTEFRELISQPIHRGRTHFGFTFNRLCNGSCATQEGNRFWPGEGIIPKYPDGNQDRCLVLNKGNVSLIGVLDGSGGAEAHQFASAFQLRLLDTFCNAEKLNGEALKSALLEAENALMAVESPPWEETCGSTATLVAFERVNAEETRLITAHLGDSRAIAVTRDGKAIPLTQDAPNGAEGLGNRIRKNSETPSSAIPHIEEKTYRDLACIAVVSDGVYNALMADSSEKANRWIADLLLSFSETKYLAAHLLIETASRIYQDNTPTKRFARDDMTAVVIYF